MLVVALKMVTEYIPAFTRPTAAGACASFA
jgi:hypothetical protein